MARFLTPSKICLLALISLYTEGVVPTSASIPVLSFIVGHVLPLVHDDDDSKATAAPAKDLVIPVEKFQEITIIHTSAIPGRTLWDLFLRRLWQINTFDAFHVFFDNFSEVLVKTWEQQIQDAEDGIPPSPGGVKLARNSPFGAFVRRCQLEFMRFTFHDSMNLWKSFIRFRQATLPMWKKRNASAGPLSFDANFSEDGFDDSNGLVDVVYGVETPSDLESNVVAAEDLEKLLDFQIIEMQKLGNRVPDDVQKRLSEMLETKMTIPSSSHYVQFLDSWRAGDYPSSFNSLHRYFDYTMLNHDRTFYQYALLNLAILQADFECYGEAIAAMQEAVCIARENKDIGCLNFSLSWLYHFSKVHPEEMSRAGKDNMLGSEEEALLFLRTKAIEGEMWSLWSTSLLSEAKLTLSRGENVASAFENILQSSHLNITKGITNVFGSQMILQSSLWGRLGGSHLSLTYCDIFLECYAQNASVEDLIMVTCRSAYILADKGQYDDANARMEGIDARLLKTLKSYQYWTVFSGLLKVKRELHRDNLEACDHLLAQLRSSPVADPEILFEIFLFEIDLLMRRQSFTEALKQLERHAEKLQEQNADMYQRIKLLLTKAELLHKCGRPERGFSVAMKAADAAWRARILPSLWDAMAIISNILNRLGEFTASTELLGAILPQVVECEDAYKTGQVYSYLVDANVGIAGQEPSASPKRTERLTKALELLDCAFDGFFRVEDIRGQCEIMAKKSTLLRLAGEVVLANDYASKYLELKRRGMIVEEK